MRTLVLTSQRSGSFFLEQCLDSHPQVRCYGEILLGFGGLYKGKVPEFLSNSRLGLLLWSYIMSGAALTPVKLLKDFYAMEEAPIMSFRAMYTHLRDPRTRVFFLKHKDIRIIHLRRDNLLKQYISKTLMHQQRKLGRKSSHTTKPVKPISIVISPEDAIQEMQAISKQFQRYDQLFADHPKIELVYETMIDGASLSETAKSAVFSLFELDPAPMESSLVKMNPNKIEQMVENYDELVEALKGTKFERFLY